MARYAILIYAGDPAHRPGDADRQPHDRHAEEEIEAGTMVAAFAFQSAATATSIRGDEVSDGPYSDAGQAVAGVYVIEAPDLDAALRVARRNPATRQGGGVEVRPLDSFFVAESAAG